MRTNLSDLTTDAVEQRLLELESYVSRIRSEQILLLREADQRQTPLEDGCRSLQEWTASRLDLAPETAKALVAASQVLQDQPDLEEQLADGLASFDRTYATAKLATAGAPADQVDQSAGLDIPGIRRLTAKYHRLSRKDHRQVFSDRFVSMQPTLDRASYRLWGQLPGTDGQLVEQALATRADTFPTLPDGTRGSLGQRNADALVSISQDSLDTSTTGNNSAGGPVLSVFQDQAIAVETSGEAGSITSGGMTVGQSTVEEINCTGSIEHIQFEKGQPIAAGRTTRAIPPKLRRAILYRDGGCRADGCTSRYRLQPHHRIPWSEGGRTDPDNLVTLCWFHHHVVTHQMGYTSKPASPPGRLRFTKPDGRDPP